MKSLYEISFYLNYSNFSLEKIIRYSEIALKTNAKSIVLSPKLFLDFRLSNIKYTNNYFKRFDQINELIAKIKIFLCFDNDDFMDALVSKESIISFLETNNNYYFKLSLNANRTSMIDLNISNILSSLNKYMPVISCEDIFLIDKNTNEGFFEDFLPGLFSLPYKQRPIVFTEKQLSLLESSLSMYNRIIIEKGLIYM